MRSAANRHIGLDQKLSVLQEADPVRRWLSLDDRRVCALCEKLITGRMIDVWQDRRGTFHLHCPTPGCMATPRDWFYHGPVRSSGSRGPKATRVSLDYGTAAA